MRTTKFDDIDVLADAARAWDLDFTQLERGAFRGELAQAVASDLNVAWARFDARMEQRGSTPPGMVTFAVPATSEFRIHWRGREVSGGQLMRFPRSRELYSISNPGFEVLTISVPESALAHTAEQLRLRDVEREVGVVRAPALADLRHAARRALVDPEAATAELCAALLRANASAEPAAASVPSAARRSALDRALEYVEAHPREAVSVREICVAADASERTLRRAFQERFAVTPKTYLRLRRLAGVRRELVRATRDARKIHEVAGRWGFWHMGQFARDYRLQFGELPSETLARSAGHDPE